MLKRQHLPLLAKLNFKIDQERLVREFFEYGYDNWNLYNGLSYSKEQEDGLVVRRVLLEYFLNDKEIAEREGKSIAEGGESYKMLCLTSYNGDPIEDSKNIADKLNTTDPHSLARRMEKISDPSHPDYVPLADEKRYDKRNKYCKGYINEVMDIIEQNIGHVTRSRFAVLMPGEVIKPHRDINTDKAVRIHIPVLTNDKTIIGVRGKHAEVEEHMPADGGVWFLNQGYEHWVRNEGDTPRVHLVFVVTGQKGILESTTKWNDYDYTNRNLCA